MSLLRSWVHYIQIYYIYIGNTNILQQRLGEKKESLSGITKNLNVDYFKSLGIL
jgi:hypothetical protein